MPDRLQMINALRREIESRQRRLASLELLEQGYLYEIAITPARNFTDVETRYLGRVIDYNVNTFRMELFAAHVPANWVDTISGTESFSYEHVLIKRIPMGDLTMYMSWIWKSNEYYKMLKGSNRYKWKE